MIKEAIELIQKTAVDAAGSDLGIIGDKHYYRQSGNMQHVVIPPAYRRSTVFSFDSFIEACKAYGSEGTVWHSADCCILLLDDTDRRESITLSLPYTQQWIHYCDGFRGGPSAARHYLKRELAGALPLEVPSLFGKVNFTRKSDGSYSTDHQKETLGKAVESEVAAADHLPDMLTLSISIYDLNGLRENVAAGMACDVDFERQQFVFEPVAGEDGALIDAAQAKLGDRLLAALPDMGIYHGTP